MSIRKKLLKLIDIYLDGKLINENKTVFVDENKVPYENQIGVLSSIKKVSLTEIELLLERIKQENEIDILPKNILKNFFINILLIYCKYIIPFMHKTCNLFFTQ